MENTQKTFIQRCKFCGHEFEYKEHDLKQCFSEEYGEPYPTVTCPKCKKDLIATFVAAEKENQTTVADGSLVKEIAYMQWKIDKMEEAIRRIFFLSIGYQDDMMIPIMDDDAIDHYIKVIIDFIKEQQKTEEK